MFNNLRELIMSRPTAWFMLHRIRKIGRVKTHSKWDNIVEVDESRIGGHSQGRLKYKNLIAAEGDKTPLTFIPTQSYRKWTVLQIKAGQIVGTLKNATQAAKSAGVNLSVMSRVLKGIKKTCRVCKWQYA